MPSCSVRCETVETQQDLRLFQEPEVLQEEDCRLSREPGSAVSGVSSRNTVHKSENCMPLLGVSFQMASVGVGGRRGRG